MGGGWSRGENESGQARRMERVEGYRKKKVGTTLERQILDFYFILFYFISGVLDSLLVPRSKRNLRIQPSHQPTKIKVSLDR